MDFIIPLFIAFNQFEGLDILIKLYSYTQCKYWKIGINSKKYWSINPHAVLIGFSKIVQFMGGSRKLSAFSQKGTRTDSIQTFLAGIYI